MYNTLMKNHWQADKSNPNYWKWQNDEMVKIPGFSGYYISRFLDIVSFRSSEGNVVHAHEDKNGKYTLLWVQLFDDSGKRRQLSVNKLYKSVLGVEEHARREKLQLNRVAVVMHEEEASQKAYEERRDAGHAEFLKERDTYFTLGNLF